MDERDVLGEAQGPQPTHHERVTGGIFLLLVGVALLARQLGAPLPDWLFTWPTILILIGLYTAFRLRFRNPVWLIPTGIGIVFLTDRFMSLNLKPLIFPVIIIGIGLAVIFRRRRNPRWQTGAENQRLYHEPKGIKAVAVADRSDFIDATAIFGAIKKMVLSKNFQGGDITNIMGGSEINLTQADFNGRARIDTTNIFGGTKLIVPAHWDVQSEVVAVFGGVDDKRQPSGLKLDGAHVLVLEGTCLFGGIEISSYS